MITLHDLRWAHVAGRVSIFLLLVVFASLTTPPVASYLHAPAVRSGTASPVRNDDLVVTLRRDGTTLVGSRWFPSKSYGEELAWLREHNPRSRLVLRADREAPFGAIRQVVRAAGDAGWKRITIECQPPTLLLERRFRAGLALRTRDDSKLVERAMEDNKFSLRGMWR